MRPGARRRQAASGWGSAGELHRVGRLAEADDGEALPGGVVEQDAVFLARPDGVGAEQPRSLHLEEQAARPAAALDHRPPQRRLARVEAVVPALDFLSEKSLRGSFYGSGNPASEIAELARLAATGALGIADSVSSLIALDGIEDAFDRLRRGEGARSVAVFDGELAGIEFRP